MAALGVAGLGAAFGGSASAGKSSGQDGGNGNQPWYAWEADVDAGGHDLNELNGLDVDHIDAIIDRHGLPAVTENTITTEAELKEELTTIAQRGYAIDDEERVKGMRCVAAPITDESNDPIGAISVSGPTNRFNDDVFDE